MERQTPNKVLSIRESLNNTNVDNKDGLNSGEHFKKGIRGIAAFKRCHLSTTIKKNLRIESHSLENLDFIRCI